MKKYLAFIFAALLPLSCTRQSLSGDVLPFRGEGISHGMIVLGGRLENPYVTDNVRKAFASLYTTKSADLVRTTNLYVRFLPKDNDEYLHLKRLGVDMLDHPVDYEIVEEGDYYQDPSVGEGAITWQYAVVPADFKFPDIRFEILDECFIAENSIATKALEDVDWEMVERQSYILTGNGDMVCNPVSGTKADKVQPSGRITIVDEDANGGQPFGLAGVKVSCNIFVKFSSTYTDRDGYYTIPKKFSSNLRYRLIFSNEKGFNIGFNLILLPASVSTLGKGPASGQNCLVTRASDENLYRRAVVNNAAYEYYEKCKSMDITPPPGDVRIWIFKGLTASSAIMAHQGAIIENNLIRGYLGAYAPLIQLFLPDITIGTKDNDSYAEIYDSVVHELSHASHFAQVGREYWEQYIFYIASTFLKTGGRTYGTGDGGYAGHCEVGEMWAYYLESMLHKERYGGPVPAYGTSFWFYPQIFRYLEDRGLSRRDIFSALTEEVSGRQELQDKLVASFPKKRVVIEQVFNRYRQ